MLSSEMRKSLANGDQKAVENLLAVALDSNFSSVMLTSASDTYTIKYVNPAFTELTGYTSDEVVGKDPGLLQGPKTDRKLLDLLRDQLQNGGTFHGKTVNYRKDGSEFTMEWKIYPIKNGENETTFFLAVQRSAP